MNSRVKQAQKRVGATIGNVAAGLFTAKNALFKVIKSSEIMMSTALSSGTHVRRNTPAFELLTGRDVICPDIAGVMCSLRRRFSPATAG